MLALLLISCGRVVPRGGAVAKASAAATSSPPAPTVIVDVSDLIPADLDLVLRVDLAEIRRGLGPQAAEELSKEAFEQARLTGIVRQALAEADLVWLAVRIADWEAGDRVLAVRLARGAIPLRPDPIAWTRYATPLKKVARFETKVAPERAGIGEVITLGDREAAFVSPVEQMSVRRVLRRGPDAQRGQPAARGLLSMDYRARPPGDAFEKRLPHLAALLAGIVRVNATVELSGTQLDLEGRIRCRSERAAVKVARFLETFKDAAARQFGPLDVKQAQHMVQLRIPIQRSKIGDLLKRRAKSAQPAAARPTPAPE